MPFASGLIAFLGFTGIVWYYICLIYLGFIHPEPTPDVAAGFREFMATSISIMSGTLATYVGMILGVQTAAKEPNANPVAAVLQRQKTPVTRLQGIAAIAYVASLLIALFAWWECFPRPDPTIEALGKSLLGLIGGALAVILNVNVRGEMRRTLTEPAVTPAEARE
jgi:hypothetical protein